MTPVRITYGLDAPGVMLSLLGAGVGLLAAGAVIAYALPQYVAAFALGGLLALGGVVGLVLGSAMLAYSVRGKFRMRELILGSIAWTGSEQVLDIGTGAGLLLIGAAGRLTTGRAIGVDIWSTTDLSGNSIDRTFRNIGLAGMTDRAFVQSGDARRLSFADKTFDCVLSLLCLHNIADKAGQRAACHEVARVLKPGGTALIADYVPTGAYAASLADAGLQVTSSRSYIRTALGLMWMVTATKPPVPI